MQSTSKRSHELLAKLYELARIDEAKNATLVQVLDAAVAPERNSGSRRGLIAILATIIALPLAVLVALTREAGQRIGSDLARKLRIGELRARLGT